MQDQATRIIAIRHGETDWNVQARIQGQLDIGLNDLGRQQAAQMAAALAMEGIDALYSSDLQRAHDTAQAIAARSGCPVVCDRGLRERAMGVFEGCTLAEIAQRWPGPNERWRQRDPAFAPAGGESLQDFYERVVATAKRLASAHPGRSLAWVAHGGVLDSLYRAATGMALQPPRDWPLGNAGINRMLFTGERFTLIGWGDVAHLESDMLLDDPVAARPA